MCLNSIGLKIFIPESFFSKLLYIQQAHSQYSTSSKTLCFPNCDMIFDIFQLVSEVTEKNCFECVCIERTTSDEKLLV